nr:AAA domain-containing protein [Paenactinomyces guangxiensis]
MTSNHLGQIKNQYELTESQRKALHHFLALQDGELLSIEGPPGTGKTTLLQSVFASMWVNSAMEQREDPPIILASGGTNLAITNILRTFDEEIVLEKSQFPQNDLFNHIDLLVERWISDVKSLGTYCIAPSKQGENQSYQLITFDKERDSGLSTNWINFEELDLEQIQTYEATFLDKASAFFQFKILDIQSARQLLFSRLQQCVYEMRGALEILSEDYLVTKQTNKLLEEYDRDSLQQIITELSEQLKELEIEREDIEKKLYKWDSQKGVRKPLEKWLLKIPMMGRLFEGLFVYANKRFVDRYLSDASISSYYDSTIEKYLDGLEKECDKKISEIEAKKMLAEDFKRTKEQVTRKLEEWDDKYEHIPKDLKEAEKEIDKKHRVLAFHLSTHYWEARWIEKAKERVTKKQGQFSNRKEFYREMAMLTPCFVSTMYMAPRYFNEKYNYFYGFTDLLIIDEASQVLPQYMFPVLTFTKKGLVVGDSKQLPPISNLSADQCEININKSGLNKTFIDMNAMGIKASNGSMLKLANYFTRYVDDDSRPFMLKEHFRCHSSIASYFNKQFYNDKLIVCSKDKTSGFGIPNLAVVNVKGQEERSGSSRINHIEAGTIALWIKDFFDRFDITTEELQRKTLAVLTPFAQQARVIRKYLGELKVSSIVVGTVHALQGSEFEIVMFSPTYTSLDTEKHFFDREPYILNVATSRAKSAFLTFGDMEAFGVNKNVPSGKLRSYSVDATETIILPERKEVDHLLETMRKAFYSKLPGRVHQINKINIINSTIDQSQVGINENATLNIN